MGVCNVTPDSFSDGGRHYTLRDACARVDALVEEGADMVEVGGESTRPGAPPVDAEEQLRRVLEVVRYAARRTCVSIDTTRAAVAETCLEAGASVVNDVTCLRDPSIADVTARQGAALVLMHARETQQAMTGFSEWPDDAYGDVVHDVVSEWRDRADEAYGRGVRTMVMDPGLGFAKNARHSAELLRRTAEVVEGAGVPVMVGASRKSFLATWDPSVGPQDRLGASVAAAVFAARQGASILRVHDVRATRQAVDLLRAMEVPRA